MFALPSKGNKVCMIILDAKIFTITLEAKAQYVSDTSSLFRTDVLFILYSFPLELSNEVKVCIINLDAKIFLEAKAHYVGHTS